MQIRFNKRIIFLLILIIAGGQCLRAQGPIYKPGEYPAPRYPQLKAHYTVDDLMPVARALVRKPPKARGLVAGYNMPPGHRVLLVVPSSFDSMVLEAIVRALREAGSRVDVVIPDAGEQRYGGEMGGHTEAYSILNPMAVGPDGLPIRDNPGFTRQRIIQLAETGGYGMLINGAGGPRPFIKVKWEYIFWDRIDKFMTGIPDYPDELQDAIDKGTWDMLLQAHQVSARDPEGTDIHWGVNPNMWEEGKKTYRSDVVSPGHVGAIPHGMAVDSFMHFDAEGVIAGTLNHSGPFPHVRVRISKAGVAGIEGGGQYGELWREALNKWKDVQWPGHPGPGINKLWEVAIGQQVGAVRPKTFLERGESWERARTGVIHWGMGQRSGFVMGEQMPKEYQEFRKTHTAPEGHVHIHTYFTTMDIETPDGKKLRLLDKGRLTVLDDPKIRQIAAKYGDPDKLLREVWIPGIPGINVPGDYMKDYASNPVPYIRKEIKENYKY